MVLSCKSAGMDRKGRTYQDGVIAPSANMGRQSSFPIVHDSGIHNRSRESELVSSNLEKKVPKMHSLVMVNIQSGTGNYAFINCIRQSFFINTFPSSDIDHPHSRLHELEGIFI